jgi:hypothetical protein
MGVGRGVGDEKLAVLMTIGGSEVRGGPGNLTKKSKDILRVVREAPEISARASSLSRNSAAAVELA